MVSKNYKNHFLGSLWCKRMVKNSELLLTNL